MKPDFMKKLSYWSILFYSFLSTSIQAQPLMPVNTATLKDKIKGGWAGQTIGVICGYRVEAIENKLMQKIRYMDKLIDELAKGKKTEVILRS
jgi:hypothetical protein